MYKDLSLRITINKLWVEINTLKERIKELENPTETIEDVKRRLFKCSNKDHKKVLKNANIRGYSRLKESELIDLRIKHKLY